MPDGAGPSIVPAENAGPDIPQQTRRRGWWRLFSGKPEEPFVHGDTLNGAAAFHDASEAEREMMTRIAAFKKKRVDDVAIPRADIVGVDVETDIRDLLKTFSEANHSRLPVYRGDLDDPLGVVHIKDVVGLLADDPADAVPGNGTALSSLVRKILYVPPSMPVTELLLRMQASRVHMALVIDEFGGTDGLVTIEDLVELIVGDIRDEHDDMEDFSIDKISEGKWNVDARVPLDDLQEQLGVRFALEDHDADTLGGLVFSLAGRVPMRGEIISHPNGAEIAIQEADPRRIQRVTLRMLPRPAAADTPEGAELNEATAAK
ncbi:hemolysin family protein [Parvularcula marina]|uniref:hemolysin family protein n=1 Tax=Parvularcula marina TaxID=2292771 RepID=UPI0035195D52